MLLKLPIVVLLVLGVFASVANADRQTVTHNLMPDLSAYIQMRGTYGNVGPAASTFTGDGFIVRRAKVILTGKGPDRIAYRLQFISKTGFPTPQLQDAYVVYDGFHFVQFVAGQMVPPFGRERLTPDWQIYTMERSQISNNLVPSAQTLARDIGVEVEGDFMDKYLHYAAGIYNGSGADTLPESSTNSNFLYVARLVANPLKENTRNGMPEISIGASIAYRKANGITNLSKILDSSLPFTGTDFRYGIDGEIRYRGFSLIGEYMRAFLDSRNEDIKSFTPDGYYVQAAYFATPFLQPVLEYQTFDPDAYTESTKNAKWLTVGLNYYITGNRLKLMADYTFERFGKLEANNTDMIRVQIQVMF